MCQKIVMGGEFSGKPKEKEITVETRQDLGPDTVMGQMLRGEGKCKDYPGYKIHSDNERGIRC